MADNNNNKKPLQQLYDALKQNNFDVPDNYNDFEATLTAHGKEGVDNRQMFYKALKDNNFDVPDNYSDFANTLFVPAEKVQPHEAPAAQAPQSSNTPEPSPAPAPSNEKSEPTAPAPSNKKPEPTAPAKDNEPGYFSRLMGIARNAISKGMGIPAGQSAYNAGSDLDQRLKELIAGRSNEQTGAAPMEPPTQQQGNDALKGATQNDQQPVQQQQPDPTLTKYTNNYNNYLSKGLTENQAANQVAVDMLKDGVTDDNTAAQQYVSRNIHGQKALGIADAAAQEIAKSMPETVNDNDVAQQLAQRYYTKPMQDKLMQDAQRLGFLDANGDYTPYINDWVKPMLARQLESKYQYPEDKATAIVNQLFSKSNDAASTAKEYDPNALNDEERRLYDALMQQFDKNLAADEATGREKANQLAGEETASNLQGMFGREGHLMQGAVPMETQREYNKYADPSKAVEAVMNKLYGNGGNGALKGAAQNGSDIDRQRVGNLLLRKITDKLVQERVPKSKWGYVLSGIADSDIGQLMKAYTKTDYERYLDDLANSQYAKSLKGFTGLLASGGHEATKFLADAWEFYGAGKVGSALSGAVRKRAIKGLTRDLLNRGIKEDVAKGIADRVFSQSIGRKAGMKAAMSAASGAGTLGAQSAFSGALRQGMQNVGDVVQSQLEREANGEHLTQKQKEKEIADANAQRHSLTNIAGTALQSGLQSAGAGATFGLGSYAGSAIGKLASPYMGDITSMAAQYAGRLGTNAAAATAYDQTTAALTGQEPEESAGKSFANNLVTFGLLDLMGIHKSPMFNSLREGKGFHPIKDLRDWKEYERSTGITDEDQERMKEAGYGGMIDTIDRLVSDRYRDGGTAVPGEWAPQHARQFSEVNKGMMDMLSDSRLPEELKRKYYMLVTGDNSKQLSPIVSTEVTQDEDGKTYLVTYNKNGNVVSDRQYRNDKAARDAATKIGYDVDENRTEALQQAVFGKDADNVLEQAYNAAVEAYKAGTGDLTLSQRKLLSLYQNRDRLANAIKAQASGEPLTEEDQQLVNAYFSIRNSLYSKDPTINGIIRDTEKAYGLGTNGLADARRGHSKKEAEELAKQSGEGIVHVGGDVYRLGHEQQAVEDYQQRLYDYLQNIQQGEATEVKEPKRLEMQEQQPTGGGESEGPTDGGTPTTPQTPTGTAQEPTPTTGEPPKAEEKPALPAGLQLIMQRDQQPTPAADQGAGTAQSQGEGAMPSWKEKAQEAYNRGASVSEDNLQDLPKMQQEISLANERFNQAFAKSLGTFRNGLIYALDNGDDDQVDQLMQQFGDRMTPAQKAAAEGLIQAANMQQGLDASVADKTGEYIDGRREQLTPLADAQGNITPLTLQDGSTVYYKQGDLQNAYGGVIVTDENGETKQIPVNSIKEVGEAQPLQTILDNESNTFAQNLQDSYAQLAQGRAVVPGQEVNINIGGQTVHAVAEQQNVDGSYLFKADDGSAFVLNPDELQQAVKAQGAVDTANQLQQEKAEEAQRQETERLSKGIKGFAEGKPDYTAKETDPKVAGEYLRAQDEQEGKKPEERLSRMQLKMNALKASAEGDAGTIEHMQNVLNIMSPSSPDYETRKKMLEDLKAKREEKLRQLRKLGELRNAYMTPEERDEVTAQRINHVSDVRKKIKGDIDALKGAAQNSKPTVKGINNEDLLANFKTQNEAAEHLAKTREGLIKVYRDGPGADIARINRELNDYKEGLTELDDDEIADKLKQLATAERIEKEDLANIKAVKDQEKKLSTLYKDRNKQELDKLSPADRRRAILGSATSFDDLRKKAKEVYKDSEMASRLDELEPETLEEYISQNLQPHSINWEGKGDNATSQRGLGQETGLKRGIGKNGDSNAINYFLAPKGEGESVDDIVHHLWEDMPDAWRDRYDDRDIKNTLLTMLTSAKNANEISGMTLHNRIRDVEDFEANEERQEAWYKEQADEDAKQRQRDIETYDDYLNETADELAISPEADNFLNGLYADELAEAAQHDADMEEAWSQIEEDKEHNDNNENDEGTKQGVTGGSHVDRQSERRPVHDGGGKGQKAVPGEESHKPKVEGSDHQQHEATHQSKTSQVRDSSANGSVSVQEGARAAGVKDDALKGAAQNHTDNQGNPIDGNGKPFERHGDFDPITSADLEVFNEKHGDNRATLDWDNADDLNEFVPIKVDGKSTPLGLTEEIVNTPDVYGANDKPVAIYDMGAGELPTLGRFNEVADLADAYNKEKGLDEGSRDFATQTEDYPYISFGSVSGAVKFYDWMKSNGHLDEEGPQQPIGKTDSPEKVEQERQAVNQNPTDGQKEAGNYKKGHINVDGYDVTIENPKGSTRSGKDADGKTWSIKMNYDYGYILGTKGVDGDHIDVYLSDNPTSGNVYVVDQINQKDGSFDEHKVMYGFPSMEAAREAYASQYEKGWKVGTITEVSREDFKKWVDSSTRKTKPFAEYKSVKEAALKGSAQNGEAPKVLLKRAGDFYELYGDDAKKASEILGITLTKRRGGNYMSGFPKWSLDTYLPKLLKAGVGADITDENGKVVESVRPENDALKGAAQNEASSSKPETKQDGKTTLDNVLDEVERRKKLTENIKKLLHTKDLSKTKKEDKTENNAEKKNNVSKNSVSSQKKPKQLDLFGNDEASNNENNNHINNNDHGNNDTGEAGSVEAAGPENRPLGGAGSDANGVRRPVKSEGSNGGEATPDRAGQPGRAERDQEGLSANGRGGSSAGGTVSEREQTPVGSGRRHSVSTGNGSPAEGNTDRRANSRPGETEGSESVPSKTGKPRQGRDHGEGNETRLGQTPGSGETVRGTVKDKPLTPKVDDVNSDTRKDNGSRKNTNERDTPLNTRNYLYPDDATDIDNMNARQRLKANVDALEVLIKVLKEGRDATAEERAILGKFRGWGGIDNIEDAYDTDRLRNVGSHWNMLKHEYEKVPDDYNRLADAIDALDKDGSHHVLESIRHAALTSYYTPIPLASVMNNYLIFAGYHGGGSMLDPSMGNGIFEGTMPKEMQQRTQIYGVELDWLTAQIARQLYPDAEVQNAGYQDAQLPTGAFDVVESNIPFGDFGVNDRSWKHDSTPLKKAAQGRIHNYFAIKMMESSRPGGLVTIMTSRAIMDTKGNAIIRSGLLDAGEFLGAVRLPNNVFKGAGTSPVTDVIFMRKYRDEEDRVKTMQDPEYKAKAKAFTTLTKITVKDKDGKDIKVEHNGYYDWVKTSHELGTITPGSQYNANDYGLTSKDSVDAIAEKMLHVIQKDIVGDRIGKLYDTHKTERKVYQAVREAYVGDGKYQGSGNIVEQNGKIGTLTAVGKDGTLMFEEVPSLSKDAARVKSYINLRTALKRLVAAQINREDESKINAFRTDLNNAYRLFTSKYGVLNSKKNNFIDEDIDSYTMRALEDIDEDTGKVRKLADIFTKDTIKPQIDVTQATDPASCITTSLAEYGEVRPSFMEEHLGKDWTKLCKGTLFHDPALDKWVVSDDYLSGDVKSKLLDAEHAVELGNDEYKDNVEALKKVQPEDILISDIGIRMGARWVPDDIYTQFMREVFGLRDWSKLKSGVRYIPETDDFAINIDNDETTGDSDRWGTRAKSPKEIFKAAMLDKEITVWIKHDDGSREVDQEQTQMANDKVEEMRDKFETWITADPERSDRLAKIYNEKFNRTVLRKWNGDFLNPAGLQGMTLRPHQKAAVWMILNNRGGIVDHIVGAGKTLVMQTAIMEMRRMGIAKKPMIIALKATVGQIAKEFAQAYPAAKILAPTEKDFSAKKRKKVLAKIANNDYDCVIISHENYTGLTHSKEVTQQIIDEQMQQLDAAIMMMHTDENGKMDQLTKRQLKGLEKRKANLQAKLDRLLDRKTDDEFCFEDLGVDYLFVDECQQFKALPYATTYNNVSGLGDPMGSQRAIALLQGVRYLQRLHQGDRGTVFLSGTTITNSLVEVYNLLNYLRPNMMAKLGYTTFDAWAAQYAVKSNDLEYGVTNELKTKARFRYFQNVAELGKLYAEIADVRNDANLKLPKPKPRTHLVTVPASDAMQDITDHVVEMVKSRDGSYFNIHPSDDRKEPWSLDASNISKAASIDPRLVFPELPPDPGSKIEKLCSNVAEIYKKFNDQKGTQLIFCDGGVPAKGKKYDAYNDIINRLVTEYHIPRKEIVDIHAAKTDDDRKALFKKVREGSVRIMIGGTKNMGTGVNVQTRLVALHHVDIPWTPADIEQRNGRGVRQGNLIAKDFNGNNVDIYYYAVEGSLDTYRYQLQDIKGKMFTQFKLNTIDANAAREFDEGAADAEGNLDPAQMVAILSGNPVIFEKSKQDKLVKKLNRQYAAEQSDYIRRRRNYDYWGQVKNQYQRMVDENAGDIRQLHNNGFTPDKDGKYPFAYKIIADGGTEYPFKKSSEAGEIIHTLVAGNRKFHLEGFGFRVEVSDYDADRGSLFGKKFLRTVTRGKDGSNLPYSIELSDDNVQAGLGFRKLLEKIISCKKIYEKNLDEAERHLQGADKLGEFKFSKEKELQEALAKQKELNEQYRKLSDDSNKPAEPKDEDETKDEPTTPEEAEEDDVRYRIVDEDEAKELDKKPTVTVYRAMQMHDGKLYPPMSGKEKTTEVDKNGKEHTKWVWRKPTEMDKWEQSEEHPELADSKGQFTLNKGNGKSIPAAYNPYIHTSRTPINDQFSSAWDRPELVTVEAKVPESELTSGYHAEKAKNSVGETPWKAGPVSNELAKVGDPRLVILSRWDKIVRVVPYDEVAKEYAKRLNKHGIAVPFNCVPPALRDALVKEGVKISEPQKGNAGDAARPAYEAWLSENPDVETREVVSFKDGEKLPIQIDGNGTNWGTKLHVDGLSNDYDDAAELLDAFRNKFPDYVSFFVDADGKKVDPYNILSWGPNRIGEARQILNRGSKYSIQVEPWSKYLKGTGAEGGSAQNSRKAFAAREQKRAQEAVDYWTKKLNIGDDVQVLMDSKGLTGKKARAKGWYDPKTGKITIVLSNHKSIDDIVQTILHEAVGHYGLRKLFGTHFDAFLDNVCNNVSGEIFDRILDKTDLLTKDMADLTDDELLKAQREATEEYLSGLAEDTNFEDAMHQGWWGKIKEFFLNMLAKVGIRLKHMLSDNELRYILWRSYMNLKEPGAKRTPADEVIDDGVQEALKVGNYSIKDEGLEKLKHQLANAIKEAKKLKISVSQIDDNAAKSVWQKAKEKLNEADKNLIKAVTAITEYCEANGIEDPEDYWGEAEQEASEALEREGAANSNAAEIRYRLNEAPVERTEAETERMKEAATDMGETLGGVPITFEKADESNVGTKGWYEPKDNSVHVVAGNHADRADVEATVCHEVLGHEGLKALFGSNAGVNKFGQYIYENAGKELRRKIVAKAAEEGYSWDDPLRYSKAAQEVFADIASQGPATDDEFNLWRKAKHYVIGACKALNIKIPGLLNDHDLRYYVLKTGKAVKTWAGMSDADKQALAEPGERMMRRGKPRKKKNESMAQFIQRLREWEMWNIAEQKAKEANDPMPEKKDFEDKAQAAFNKAMDEWRLKNNIQPGDEEPDVFPRRKDGESPQDYAIRVADYETTVDKWKEAPDIFEYEKKAMDEWRTAYEAWKQRYDIHEMESVDEQLYSGIGDDALKGAAQNEQPSEGDIEVDDATDRELSDAVGVDTTPEGAQRQAKLAVIERRKNLESSSADDAIFIHDLCKDIDAVGKELGLKEGELRSRLINIIEAPVQKKEAEKEVGRWVDILNKMRTFQDAHSFITVDGVKASYPELKALEHLIFEYGDKPKTAEQRDELHNAAVTLANKLNDYYKDTTGYHQLFGDDIVSVSKYILKMALAADDMERSMALAEEPKVQELVGKIHEWYDDFYHAIEDAGLRGDAGYIPEGYINHIWDKDKSDKEAWNKYIENYQRTKSANMRHRDVPTYSDGIQLGLVPKFDDVAKIMSYYSRQNNEAIANKKFLDDLSFLTISEKNEDGEVTRTLPVMNSHHPNRFDEERYKMYHVPGVGDVWVLKEVSRRFASIFGTMRTQDAAGWLSNIGKGYDMAGSVMKKIQLGFSGFHMQALSEVALAQMRPDRGMKAIFKYILLDSIRNNGEIPAYAHPEDFKFAASHLVQLGATQDYAAADVNMITQKFRNFVKGLAKDDNFMKKVTGKALNPFAVMLDWINQGTDKVLWNYLHDGLKIACFKYYANQIDKKVEKEHLSEQQRDRLLDEAGQYTNDTFGGQYWELLNVSPATLKWLRRAFLSPDWLVSTQRHFFSNFGFGSLYDPRGFVEYVKESFRLGKAKDGALKGAAQNAADVDDNIYRKFRSKEARLCYFLGVCGFFYTIMNGLNAVMRAKDEEKEKEKAEEERKTNPAYRSPYELAYPNGMKWYDYTMLGNSLGQQTHLFMGRYKDGTEMYVRWGKQFREFPEMFIGRKGLDFPAPMIQRMMGKANPVIGLVRDNLGALGIWGFENSTDIEDIQAKYGKTIGVLAMNARHFIPYSLPTQADKEFKMIDLFMPSTKGFTQYKTIDYFKDFIKAGDIEGVKRTYKAAMMNGIDVEKCLIAAITTLQAEQRDELRDGISDLTSAFDAYNNAKTLSQKKAIKVKLIKYLADQNYKAYTRDEALQTVQAYLNGTGEEASKDNDKYIMQTTAEDIRDDYKLNALDKQAKTYVNNIKQAQENGDGATAAKLAKRYGAWVEIHQLVGQERREAGKLKKMLGKGDDAGVMKEIRKLRKETQKQIDAIEPPK